MDEAISFYDAGAKGFYHGLVLGLIAMMDNQYKIKSNRESGDGRYDICMFPRGERYPGIIMELKWKKNLEKMCLANWPMKLWLRLVTEDMMFRWQGMESKAY